MLGTVSILGLLNYDNTIFDDMAVPSVIDKTLLVENIVENCAELELLYPDVPTMKRIIPNWSARRLPVWARMGEALAAEYNFLHNYDRTESWTDTREGEKNVTGSRSVDRDGDNVHAETSSGTEGRTTTTSGTEDKTVTNTGTVTTAGTGNKSITTHSETESTGTTATDETTTNKVVGYDSTALVNHDQGVKDGDVTTSGTTETDGTETDQETNSQTETRNLSETMDSDTTGSETVSGTTSGTRNLTDTIDETEAETSSGNETSEETSSHSGRVSGNIGVTTSQQMIEAEVRLRMYFDLYTIITQEFKEKFCLLLY